MLEDIEKKLKDLPARAGGDIHGDAHSKAEDLLLEALERLGHKEISDAFRSASIRCGFYYS